MLLFFLGFKLHSTFLQWSVAAFAGILRDKTMEYKLVYIPNDDKQNFSFYRLKLMIKKARNC